MQILRPLLVQLALNFLAALGTLQIIAVRHDLAGLAWPFDPLHRRMGQLCGLGLLLFAFWGEVVLALADALLPYGLLFLVLGVGIGGAFAFSIGGAGLRIAWRRKKGQTEGRKWARLIDLGPLRAEFYQPVKEGPLPAICLLPDPISPDDDLSQLIQAFVTQGFCVLAFGWRSLGNTDRLTLQGFVAVGISHLSQWSETDAQRVCLVGIGLGGDLALRSAAMDNGVAAVVAIEPVFSTDRPGLGLQTLRTLSWFEARRRVARWRRSPLPQALNAPIAVPCIAPRPSAVVVSYPGDLEHVGEMDVIRVTGGNPFKPAAHTETINRVADWLMENV